MGQRKQQTIIIIIGWHCCKLSYLNETQYLAMGINKETVIHLFKESQSFYIFSCFAHYYKGSRYSFIINSTL